MANEVHYTGRQIDALDHTGNAIRRPLLPAIRWGAVLAGVAVGISVQLALTLLGIAAGLSSLEPAEGNGGPGVGSLLWAGLTMLVSAFVGGYVAARMSGLKRKSDGVLHGAVSWAVTTILFAVMATSIGSSMLSGVFSNMGQMARGALTVPDSPLAAMLHSQAGRLDAAAMADLQRAIRSGDREAAVQRLTLAGVPQERAGIIADQALIISGLPANASAGGRANADNAVRTVGATAWIVFGAVALALVLGISGGALGAAGSRRVSWAAERAGRPS
ncbi:hypothetical protein SAMN06265795_102348 [Noviherbaspirillum humi]|uniref:PhnA-like protein n=1 Tax=Noviherbaspirillum humi TaxID=1688639 RepID=A0A239DT03_9BURK|nr:hypothetical protein [Noviherbaspirillum humi]SNS35467.1 hypothetical protein SAMN06265795_102348 [Noviherbaspirillum humi]